MLLSIDRAMQLLAEGKSLEKIADLSNADIEDVRRVINEAREMLNNYDKAKSKKKIIIKKKENVVDSKEKWNGETNEIEIFEGSELSAVPLGSSLVIYTDGASSGNPGPAGIGIVIYDKEDRTVGKVSSYIGSNTNNFAEYTALLRALKIAIYFNTKQLKIRTDSELIVKQIKGEYKVTNETIKPLYDEALKLKRKINSSRIEHVSRSLNEKADFLAKKAVSAVTKEKK